MLSKLQCVVLAGGRVALVRKNGERKIPDNDKCLGQALLGEEGCRFGRKQKLFRKENFYLTLRTFPKNNSIRIEKRKPRFCVTEIIF